MSASAQAVDWPTLGFSQVVPNTFVHPIGITHAGDGSQRLFIVQQPGQVLIVQNNAVLAQPFLNISNRVLSAGAEQGLLGLAFPSGFSTKGHFYVDYTRKPDGAIVVSRFFLTATNSNVANTNSEQIVLVIPKPTPGTTYNNHNAGQLAFGPDGYLYIGVGDGGSEGDPLHYGQATTNMFAKILRIDVESGVSPYAIPPNNPFVSSNNFVHETWAYGLRNPWRFSFDDQTGDLYIGDVGENNYEEIDFQAAGSAGGQNYGWSIMEGFSNYDIPTGFTNFSALTLPVAVYSHAVVPTDFQAAIIGGYVYRGPSQPRMDGMYFFGDFEAGWIWGLKRAGTNWQNQVLLNPPVSSTNFMISTFGEDDQHNLYLADYSHGLIYQIDDSLQTWTPTFSPTGGVVNSSAVIVNCLTTNAEIHYTTNGVNPTVSDPVVASGGSIIVTTGFTNKLWAFRPDLAPSGVATAVFTLQAGKPVFSPSSGPITNGTLISMSCVTPGAVIYYTLDGSTPTTSSAIYSGPVEINGGTTVKAIAIANNYLNSSVQSTFFQLVQTATPLFSPASGPLIYGTNITISCATPDSTIYYTLDGTSPTTNSQIYSGPLAIYNDTTLNAFATAPGNLNSAVQSQSYTLVTAATPVFTPAQGPLTNGTLISISTATSNAIVYYTLDGTTPTTNSPVYSVPILFTNPMTLSAGAKRYDLDFSPVNSVFYGLLDFENSVVMTFAGSTNAGFTSGWGTLAQFSHPEGICIDAAGNLYVSDTGNNSVREISPAGLVTTYTNTMGAFSAPMGIGVDPAGNVYVANVNNNQVCKITTNGVITTLANISLILSQLACDSAGNIYAGTWASIDKISSNGNVVQFAGTHANSTYNWGIYIGVGIDASTNIYAATDNHIWIIDPTGNTTLFAGNNNPGFSDGPRLLAYFKSPQDAAIDLSTNVFVTETNRLRKISFDGSVSTLAGNGTNGYQNGRGINAQFNGLEGLCVDTNGNIFVADSGNNCIREISPDTAGIGIPDWWQKKYFGYVGIDPNSDPNNNGMTAYEDFWAGLNPANPASVFKIESATVTRNGTQVSWDSVLGKNYTVQWSSDLKSWNALAGPISGTGSIISYADSTPEAQNAQRFYRIVVSF